MATMTHFVTVGIACIQASLQRWGSVQMLGVCVTMRLDAELRTYRSCIARQIVEPAPNDTHAV